jgi:hypothetical protein
MGGGGCGDVAGHWSWDAINELGIDSNSLAYTKLVGVAGRRLGKEFELELNRALTSIAIINIARAGVGGGENGDWGGFTFRLGSGR